MSYRDTCPQQTVTEVWHTTATWLPVTLSCGHVESINWTARVGDKIGCTHCAEKYIVEQNPGGPYWVDGQGWATTDSAQATRYDRTGANKLAHEMHGFSVLS